MAVDNLNLSDFKYELPDEKIAKHPLNNRSDSKLLSYNKGEITHRKFENLVELLPEGSHLIFNDTKVIPARLIFHKETGARIEIFLLEPMVPSHLHMTTMAALKTCTWHCMIGNARKWKEGNRLQVELPSGVKVYAIRNENEAVTFNWESEQTFSEIVSEIGNIPLPPYLNRVVEEDDKPRYQTVYSNHEGAVAAPTAGLHFTDEILKELSSKKITQDYVTLHVSAGTFQPIKAKSVEDHPMHKEQLVLSRSNIEKMMENNEIFAVGTTSMRTIESLYWFGVMLASNEQATFFIKKLRPYEAEKHISKNESLQHVLNYMTSHKLDKLYGETEIFICPGYKFRICKGLITNFHLPGSTLILLVAAFIGEDWKKIYNAALVNDYRFLSYGDSSLLIP